MDPKSKSHTQLLYVTKALTSSFKEEKSRSELSGISGYIPVENVKSQEKIQTYKSPQE